MAHPVPKYMIVASPPPGILLLVFFAFVPNLSVVGLSHKSVAKHQEVHFSCIYRLSRKFFACLVGCAVKRIQPIFDNKMFIPHSKVNKDEVRQFSSGVHIAKFKHVCLDRNWACVKDGTRVHCLDRHRTSNSNIFISVAGMEWACSIRWTPRPRTPRPQTLRPQDLEVVNVNNFQDEGG